MQRLREFDIVHGDMSHRAYHLFRCDAEEIMRAMRCRASSCWRGRRTRRGFRFNDRHRTLAQSKAVRNRCQVKPEIIRLRYLARRSPQCKILLLVCLCELWRCAEADGSCRIPVYSANTVAGKDGLQPERGIAGKDIPLL
jgi:hypothetical protein